MELRTSALLSAKRAIAGEITPEMRAISVEIEPAYIKIWVYYNGIPPADIVEEFDACVVTQIVADFPDTEKGDPEIKVEFVQLDRPLPISIRGELIFAFKNEKFKTSTYA